MGASTFGSTRTVPVLYALVGFQGDDTSMWTQEDVRVAAGTGARSVEKYFLAASGNNFDFVPTVVDWTHVAIPAPLPKDCGDRTGLYGAEVDAAIEQQHPEVQLSDYKHIVYLSPPGTATVGCYAYGLTAAPSKESLILAPNEALSGVIDHETMHAFGFNHEQGLACLGAGGSPAAVSSSCTQGDWADYTDIMSGEDLPLTGTHRLAAGLLPFDNLRTQAKPAAGSPVTVTLNSVDATVGAGSTQVLRIPRAVGASDPTDQRPYYYLEYRTPSAPIIPSAPLNTKLSLYGGISIRRAPAYAIGNTKTQPVAPQTVNPSVGRGFPDRPDDGHPGQFVRSPDWNARVLFQPAHDTESPDYPDPDVALKVGQSFYDPIEDYTFTTVSAGASSAQVTITAGSPAMSNATLIGLVGDQVNVIGSTGRVNDIIVSKQGNELLISDYGNSVQATGTACRKADVQTVACRLSAVASIDIAAGDKDDTVAIGDSVPASISTLLEGQEGDDSLEGGPGADTIDGGPGADAIDGGAGNDTVTYASRTAPVTIAPAPRPRGATPWDEFRLPRGSGEAGENDGITKETENLIGGSGADTIQIDAGDGTTREVDGRGGADKYYLGSGTTKLTTQDGAADSVIDCRTATTTWRGDSADSATAGSCGSKLFTSVLRVGSVTPARSTSQLSYAEINFATGVSGTSFECGLDAPGVTGAYSACTSPYQVSSLTNGAYTLKVRLKQGSTYVDTVTRAFTVNTTAPGLPTITGSASTADRTPTFGISATAADAYECKVNGGAWAGCPASFTLPDQTGASATIAARALSATGVVGAETTVKTVTFTSAVPDTTRVSGVANGDILRTQSPTLSFSGPSGGTFKCKVDQKPAETCTSPLAPDEFPHGLRDGAHQFTVTATDASGNADTTPLVVAFTIDTPKITITPSTGQSDLPTFTNLRKGTFTFTATGGGAGPYHYECVFDWPNWQPCTPGTAFTRDRTGSGDTTVAYDYGVQVLDASNTIIGTEYRQATVLIDQAAPDASFAGGPAEGGTTPLSGAAYTFGTTSRPLKNCDRDSGNPSCVSFEARVDSGTFAKVGTTWSTGALTAGSHTIEVRARDLAGNVGATAVRHVTAAASKLLTMADPVATPSKVYLTSDGDLGPAIDWVHWKGTAATSIDRKAGTAVIPSWTLYAGNTWTATTFASLPIYSWSNASAAPTTSQSALGVSGGGRNGRGFTLSIPAQNTQTRKLKLWIGVKGTTTTGAIYASFNGETPTLNKQIGGNSDTSAVNRVVTIDYRPLAATDTLTVSWFQGGGPTASTSQVVLYGAALY